ncbi:TPA: hypothetical protein IUT65_000617 [Enterococcus faecalis]|nr:hypothetical protein [Enterococcus faecalis]HCT6554222.1 hypothetical protein [Enterococcus faecalis]HCT6555674.1 hypothetical protein [Enterococcus faecalis]
MLTIYLKSGAVIDVPTFKEVSYYSAGKLKTITQETIDNLYISPGLTYKFKGDKTVILNGDEIQYLEII